jgi:hypothetical protein
MTAFAEKCPKCRGSIVRLVGLLRPGTPVYAEVCLECPLVVRSGHLQRATLSRRRRPTPRETRMDGWSKPPGWSW